MQIPFADAVLNLVGRRPAALDLIEDIEQIESAGEAINYTGDDAELPSTDTALLLQKMESRLVRHHLENPDVLSPETLRKLRYVLNFARLADFEPGLPVRAEPADAGTCPSAPRSHPGARGSPTLCTGHCARSATRRRRCGQRATRSKV